MSIARAHVTLRGRFSSNVILRRMRSLGFELQGKFGGNNARYLVPVKRSSDGAVGVLELWWTERGGWCHVFKASEP